MDEKKEKCKRCGAKITPKTKRAEFCSNKCKVYWHREKKRKVLVPEQIPEFNESIKNMPQAVKDKVDTSIANADVEIKMAELQKELAAIPDKTKGFGKQLADSIDKRIKNLRLEQSKLNKDY